MESCQKYQVGIAFFTPSHTKLAIVRKRIENITAGIVMVYKVVVCSCSEYYMCLWSLHVQKEKYSSDGKKPN